MKLSRNYIRKFAFPVSFAVVVVAVVVVVVVAVSQIYYFFLTWIDLQKDKTRKTRNVSLGLSE